MGDTSPLAGRCGALFLFQGCADFAQFSKISKTEGEKRREQEKRADQPIKPTMDQPWTNPYHYNTQLNDYREDTIT